jgi:hypothetical protein
MAPADIFMIQRSVVVEMVEMLSVLTIISFFSLYMFFFCHSYWLYLG